MSNNDESDGSDGERSPWLIWTARLIHETVRNFQNVERENDHRATQESAANRTANATIAMAAFSAAILVVGILQYLVFNNQLGAMQAQLEEMRAQQLMTIAQLRADLKQGEPQIVSVRDDGKPAQPGDIVAAWEVSPQWANSGETDARGYVGWFDLKPVSITGPHHLSAADCPTPIRRPAKPTDIPHGQGFRMLAKRIQLRDAVQAAGGQGLILVAGHLEYRDIFPNTPTHHADWCVDLLPNDLKKNVWSPFVLFQTAD